MPLFLVRFVCYSFEQFFKWRVRKHILCWGIFKIDKQILTRKKRLSTYTTKQTKQIEETNGINQKN
jgi:hypothetical protein